MLNPLVSNIPVYNILNNRYDYKRYRPFVGTPSYTNGRMLELYNDMNKGTPCGALTILQENNSNYIIDGCKRVNAILKSVDPENNFYYNLDTDNIIETDDPVPNHMPLECFYSKEAQESYIISLEEMYRDVALYYEYTRKIQRFQTRFSCFNFATYFISSKTGEEALEIRNKLNRK